ncbi:carbonic anhydrase [Campylobacter ureolyticus]|uniref:carbonic anhydrase n=1 Tax=Campylobacter ureolyticus TaxID=827 RepID=UPI000685A0E5|nr:carbonic anhydrase [Campylobacter ureolyticus]MCR8699625.1 carbonic anhydrase [Campylobacter ureolyticus]MCZ6111607.1 carbonic anhydrase [Campylobacter ureolyticus]MCZ6134822.1 carbonic anhydrase [Campylobacter ureolyticus]MCZ6150389.1 carbonic anhydrase [Campylobacter ureolyticus]MCZ6156417.1 carbonic anhydrase [Campylobacter ureolyticus]
MEKYFKENAELFKTLKDSQTPHTLFIGCSDSRVVPNLITNTKPGEMFVIRNIANIIPKYRVSDEFLATTSAIEYALYILNIKDIIICGHSNCGGCAALYYDESKFDKTPNVKTWLKSLDNVKAQVEALGLSNLKKKAWFVERLNIVNSIDNLLTYPGVKEGVKLGKIRIYGWHYIIETGSLFSYDMVTKDFELLNEGSDYEKIYNEIFADN